MPEANLVALPCKIDTGADTSAIHCDRIRIKEINGKDYLVFKLLDRQHPLYTGKDITTSKYVERKVKSSFGDYEYRYQVILTIVLFGHEYPVPFNLSNRKNMKYPVLLGRKFLKNRFVVDVSKRDLSFKEK
ncbi:MAG: ATP-dependent zinc protease [Flavobacteriales bacterium]|nr:ATP-dependent zinc protease [Flavobacteriales bacterium]